MCKNCELKPVYTLQNDRKLCRSCFNRYFEKKVRKTIRKFKLIDKKDKVVVACSGGKDSLSVLSILNEISKNTKQFSIGAVGIDEGTDYRKKTLKVAEEFCDKNNICFEIISFKGYFGEDLDKLIKKISKKNPKIKACSICDVLKRIMLNDYCNKVKADKLCTGHNMDDEAQSIIINQFRRNIDCSARLGPITGVKKEKRFVRRINPLYLMVEEEIELFAKQKRWDIKKDLECPYTKDSYRESVKKILNNVEKKYPGTKNSIISSFLEIAPLLKKKYKGSKIGQCKKCGESTSSEKCQVCNMLNELK